MPLTEIADRVWTLAHPDGGSPVEATLTLVGGTRGLALVDLPATSAGVQTLLDDVRRLGAGEVVALVWTHGHAAHVRTTSALRAALGSPLVHAHEAAALDAAALPEPAAPDSVLSSVAVVDLGDRVVELLHPGRGHSAGDLVALVPDADVLLAGDLVTAAGGVPDLGADCFPLDWPLSLDLVLDLSGSATRVLPGHGSPVDREVVEDQRHALAAVAETTRELVARGVPLADALVDPATRESWPYPAERLADAVRRGYEQLPRGQRRLPLV